MDIQILEIKPISQGNLKAFVSLQIDGITIHDFRIVQQAGQRAWVSAPCTSWTDKGGKTCWKPLVELSPLLKSQVSETIFKAWNANGN